MANMIQNAKDSINALLEAACARAVEKGQLPEGASLSGTVEIPKDTQNGDYAANHAMTGARALHMAPRKIAEALVENLDLDGSWFSSVEVRMCFPASGPRTQTTAVWTRATAKS